MTTLTPLQQRGADLAARSRSEQGFPEHVEDAVALGMIAEAVREALDSEAAA